MKIEELVCRMKHPALRGVLGQRVPLAKGESRRTPLRQHREPARRTVSREVTQIKFYKVVQIQRLSLAICHNLSEL